jgi:hypothetical protein
MTDEFRSVLHTRYDVSHQPVIVLKPTVLRPQPLEHVVRSNTGCGRGALGSIVVKALFCKPDSRRFEIR